ncbi:MAG: hypothetical protein QXT28_06265 [Thermofilaceae archaeon]
MGSVVVIKLPGVPGLPRFASVALYSPDGRLDCAYGLLFLSEKVVEVFEDTTGWCEREVSVSDHVDWLEGAVLRLLADAPVGWWVQVVLHGLPAGSLEDMLRARGLRVVRLRLLQLLVSDVEERVGPEVVVEPVDPADALGLRDGSLGGVDALPRACSGVLRVDRDVHPLRVPRVVGRVNVAQD